jgi:hypothetical protein
MALAKHIGGLPVIRMQRAFPTKHPVQLSSQTSGASTARADIITNWGHRIFVSDPKTFSAVAVVYVTFLQNGYGELLSSMLFYGVFNWDVDLLRQRVMAAHATAQVFRHTNVVFTVC